MRWTYVKRCYSISSFLIAMGPLLTTITYDNPVTSIRHALSVDQSVAATAGPALLPVGVFWQLLPPRPLPLLPAPQLRTTPWHAAAADAAVYCLLVHWLVLLCLLLHSLIILCSFVHIQGIRWPLCRTLGVGVVKQLLQENTTQLAITCPKSYQLRQK